MGGAGEATYIEAADRGNPNVWPGLYTMVRALPFVGHGPQYRVKHALDSHERVVDEGRLRAA